MNWTETTNTFDLDNLFIGSLLISFETNENDSMNIDGTIIKLGMALIAK